MRELGKVIVQIPARGGSKRVPAKNLRPLAGKPMIAYAIENALACAELAEVYVNTDSDEIAATALRYGALVYRRPAELGSDTATGDDFTADFIEKLCPDTLIMVSPVCPLIEPGDIKGAMQAYRESACDTLISCEQTRMQTFCEGRPVNIDDTQALAPTQSNSVVEILNWAVTIWDAQRFVEAYKASGSAYLGRERLLYPLPLSRSLKVSYPEDFEMAELLLNARVPD